MRAPSRSVAPAGVVEASRAGASAETSAEPTPIAKPVNSVTGSSQSRVACATRYNELRVRPTCCSARLAPTAPSTAPSTPPNAPSSNPSHRNSVTT